MQGGWSPTLSGIGSSVELLNFVGRKFVMAGPSPDHRCRLQDGNSARQTRGNMRLIIFLPAMRKVDAGNLIRIGPTDERARLTIALVMTEINVLRVIDKKRLGLE